MSKETVYLDLEKDHAINCNKFQKFMKIFYQFPIISKPLDTIKLRLSKRLSEKMFFVQIIKFKAENVFFLMSINMETLNCK